MASYIVFHGNIPVVQVSSAVKGASKGAAAGAAAGSVIPGLGNVVGGVVGGIVGGISSMHAANVAKARAKDAADRQKALDFITGNNLRDRIWGAEYIIKNRSFYTPDLQVAAVVGAHTRGASLDYNDPVNITQVLNYLKTTRALTEVANGTAGIVYDNQGYFKSSPSLIALATVYMQTGGKSRDYAAIAQPMVTMPSSSEVSKITMASVFSGKMFPIFIISGTLIAVGYKFFFEKKQKRGRKR
jgi:hypothetical protein